MYRHTQDFLDDWKQESENTLKYFDVIPETALEQRVDPEGRTLKQIAWHVVDSLAMLKTAGLELEVTPEGTPAPETMAEIKARYAAGSEALLRAVGAGWPDESLQDDVPMYGDVWKKGLILAILVVHQTHHRGQMSVLMRQAGLRVPGIYGPSREEWVEMGMEAQA